MLEIDFTTEPTVPELTTTKQVEPLTVEDEIPITFIIATIIRDRYGSAVKFMMMIFLSMYLDLYFVLSDTRFPKCAH